MKYWAEVIDGVVKQVQVSLDAPGNGWIECGNGLRKQYPGEGYTYDSNADVFIAPKPYASWILDQNHDWQPPVPRPEGAYIWDESQLNWKEDK